MNPKQAAFVREYVVDYNATQAAIRAGYSPKTAGVQGHDLLKKPNIAAEVKRLSNVAAEELGITKKRILEKIWSTVEKAYDGAPKTDKNGEAVRVLIDGEEQTVYDWSPAGTLKGLELLMKHAGLLTDKVEHSGGIDIRINGVDVDQLR